jgi:tetratricopeptide (TPR) repeat protein
LRTFFNPLGPLCAGFLVASVSLFASQAPANNALTQANAALQAGEADHALELLQPLTGAGANQPEADNLECRVRLNLEQWDRAVAACEKAVRLDAENAGYHLWLGRALGEKASRASFMSAYSLGKRVRDEFEASVRLNPRNPEALADLGEFYYSAPAIVGGGSDKA